MYIARVGHLRQFMAMHYTTVFSAGDFPPRFWWLPAFGLIFVIPAAIGIFAPGSLVAALSGRDGRQDPKFTPWFALLFRCVWIGLTA